MTLGEMVAQYRAGQIAADGSVPAGGMPQQASVPSQATTSMGYRQAPSVQTQQIPAQNFGLAQMLQYHPMYRNRYDLIRGAMF